MTFTWTPLTGDDVDRWAELLTAVEAEDRTGDNYSRSDLLQDLALADPAEGTCGVWDGDRLVAFGVVYAGSVAEPGHIMRTWGAVHPAYRRRGLGGRLMNWTLQAGRRVHEGLFPGRPLSLHVYVHDGNEGAGAVARAAGMLPVRTFHVMTRDLAAPLPESHLPEGLKIVPYGDDLEEAAREVRNAAFADHWGSTPHTAESWREKLIRLEAFSGKDSFVVQEESGRSVGILLTFYYAADTEVTGVREAWVQTVATLEDWRGRGVAGALLAHALAHFRSEGYGKAALSVDTGNATGAPGVYLRAGFEVSRGATAYVADL
ncbi:GNAT family N-acetyltransferase [Streptosporangium sp. NPDC000239]|uniref:GNAT family N-acetyltransferase n=1 Tax=Streptosporangium sp. NPDC000239 TaxID=3154248 RepID=UPI003329C4FF